MVNKMIAHVFEAISLLKPYDIDKPKVLIGKERDGGYVMADIPGSSAVLSFGVGPDVSFECHLANQGRQIYLSDHTVSKTPETHRLFSFERVGICQEGFRDKSLAPLSYHIRKLRDPHGCILKIDIDGPEWDVLSSITLSMLDPFDQIVMEGHWLSYLEDEIFAGKVRKSLETLNKQFTLFHVHANNCADLHIIGGFAVADVIELSYIRTSSVQRSPSKTIYPSINKPNHPLYHDHALLFYPFLPEDNTNVSDVVRTIALEEAEVQSKLARGEPIIY